jgi:hypothetical protein
MDIFLEVLQRKLTHYLLKLNILQYQNGVKVGFGKNIKKLQIMHLMELIQINIPFIDVY